jgi:hypothetical protein
VSIEPYDGLALPETVDLNFFTTWLQIHKIPVGYRKESFIKNLTERKVGKVVETQLNVLGAGNFVRVRVRLDVRKPLARFVSVSREGEREIYPIKFEKMPRFCGACGFVGHTHLECGTGEFDEDKLKWGDFLKADWDSWHARGTGGSRGGSSGRGVGDRTSRGRMGGRGREGVSAGRGEGNPPSWRYNALAFVDGRALVDGAAKITGNASEPNDTEIMDTASSPGKKDMEVDKQNSLLPLAKRALELGDENLPSPGSVETVVTVTGTEAMATDGNTLEPSGTEVEKDRAKRTKKDGANSSSLGSAGSQDDPVRTQ